MDPPELHRSGSLLCANYVQRSTVWYALQIRSGNLPPEAAPRAHTTRIEHWTRHLSITSQQSRDKDGTRLPYLSNAVLSRQSPFLTSYFVVLNPLVSLIRRLVACSARLGADTHTHRPSTVAPRCATCRGLISIRTSWDAKMVQ